MKNRLMLVGALLLMSTFLFWAGGYAKGPSGNVTISSGEAVPPHKKIPNYNPEHKIMWTDVGRGVMRMDSPDVICYTLSHHDAYWGLGGISCLPRPQPVTAEFEAP